MSTPTQSGIEPPTPYGVMDITADEIARLRAELAAAKERADALAKLVAAWREPSGEVLIQLKALMTAWGDKFAPGTQERFAKAEYQLLHVFALTPADLAGKVLVDVQLVPALDAYVAFLTKSLSDAASFLAVHGWHDSEYDCLEGQRLRAAIAAARKGTI